MSERIYIEPCEETFKRIPDNSVDLIVTSPPYNIATMHSNAIYYGSYANNDLPEASYQNWQIQILNECHRILTPTGSIFYNHKVRIKDGVAIHPMQWLLQTPLILKQEITWDLGKSANCDKRRFFPFSERIYWLTKDAKIKLINNRKLSDVWRLVPTHNRKDTGHIAVMPEEIVQIILDSLPQKPNLCYDPFGGTGTTARICEKNSVPWMVSEIDEKNRKIIEKRVFGED